MDAQPPLAPTSGAFPRPLPSTGNAWRGQQARNHGIQTEAGAKWSPLTMPSVPAKSASSSASGQACHRVRPARGTARRDGLVASQAPLRRLFASRLLFRSASKRSSGVPGGRSGPSVSVPDRPRSLGRRSVRFRIRVGSNPRRERRAGRRRQFEAADARRPCLRDTCAPAFGKCGPSSAASVPAMRCRDTPVLELHGEQHRHAWACRRREVLGDAGERPSLRLVVRA